MGFAKKIGVSAVIHAGDWNTLEAIDAVLSVDLPLYAVLGNADVRPEVEKRLEVKSKKFSPEFLEVVIGGKRIGITHKPTDNKKFFKDKNLDIIFNGHYHSKDESTVGEVKIIRPGAIINGINFAVYDTASGKIEFVNE